MNTGDSMGMPETKAVTPLDLPGAFGEFMAAFEAFKDANDLRLGQIERRMSADVVTTEKADRISRTLDEQKRALDTLNLKKARPILGGEGRPVDTEHKQAFEAYVRTGDDRLLRSLDTKAMSYGSGQDGGYLVPSETETEIGKRLSLLSPIRGIASVRQVSSAVLKKPFSISGPAVGWVAEKVLALLCDHPLSPKSCVGRDGDPIAVGVGRCAPKRVKFAWRYDLRRRFASAISAGAE